MLVQLPKRGLTEVHALHGFFRLVVLKNAPAAGERGFRPLLWRLDFVVFRGCLATFDALSPRSAKEPERDAILGPLGVQFWRKLGPNRRNLDQLGPSGCLWATTCRITGSGVVRDLPGGGRK